MSIIFNVRNDKFVSYFLLDKRHRQQNQFLSFSNIYRGIPQNLFQSLHCTRHNFSNPSVHWNWMAKRDRQSRFFMRRFILRIIRNTQRIRSRFMGWNWIGNFIHVNLTYSHLLFIFAGIRRTRQSPYISRDAFLVTFMQRPI